MRKTPWLSCVLTVGLALSMATACDDDSTSPGNPDDVDPVSTSQALDAVTAKYFTGNDAVQSLNALAPFMVGAGLDIIPAVVAPAGDPTDLQAMATTAWDAVLEVQGRRDSGARLMSIPVGLLGKTFVFNLTTGQYELDDTRTDAPSNGVRFILYAVDPITLQPIDPLQEVGYVDIVDTSSLPTINVALTAVVDDVTLIDYDVTATATETQFSMNSDGFLSDGTDQLNFDVALTATGGTETLTIDGDVNLATTDVTVSVGLDATVDAQTGDGTVGLNAAIDYQGNTVSFSTDIDAQGNLTGSVLFNGVPVALISGNIDTETVTVTNAEGAELTEAQLDALEEMFDAFGNVFEAAGGLVILTFVLIGFAF